MTSDPKKRTGRERAPRAGTASSGRTRVGAVLLAAAALLSGCAIGHSVARPEGALPRLAGTRVLVMEPDVQLWALSAIGGVRQPQAEWTAAGREHVRAAVLEELRARGAEPVPLRVTDDPARNRARDQLVRLHRVVLGAAQTQQGPLQLPTRTGGLDWTLGDGVRGLREESGADHALFVLFDDSYQSLGATGSTVVVIMTLGLVAPPPGVQVGNASLVDLRTGDLVWTRVFTRRGAGDLRQPGPARTAVGTLLKDLPR